MHKITAYTTISDDDTMLEIRQIGGRVWQFVEIMDLHAVTGESTGARYAGEVSHVDLDAIGERNVRDALRSWGFRYDDHACQIVNDHGDIVAEGLACDRVMAEVCQSYGCKAPMWSGGGNNRRNLHRAARSEAATLARDEDARSEAMDRPVNAIGSTAAEYMAGDITSAIERGVRADDTSAKIMAKAYGVPAEVIDRAAEAGPADRLAAWCGYGDGKAGRPAAVGASPDYYTAHKVGAEVAAGKRSRPSWALPDASEHAAEVRL